MTITNRDGEVLEQWTLDQPEPPRQWVLTDWIPAGRVTILTGPSDAGRSLLLLQLAEGVASGGGELGRWIAGAKASELRLGAVVGSGAPVVYATWEAEPDDLRRQLAGIAGDSAPWCSDSLQDLALVDMLREGATWGGQKSELLPAGAKLRALAESEGAELVVLDDVTTACDYQESYGEHPAGFLRSWDAWASEHDCAVLIVARPPDRADAFGGSTAWAETARAILAFTSEKVRKIPRGQGVEADHRSVWKLARVKANYAEPGKRDAYALELDASEGLRWQVVGEWPKARGRR